MLLMTGFLQYPTWFLGRFASREEASSELPIATYIVFSNQALPPSSHGQPTAVSIACIGLGVSHYP